MTLRMYAHLHPNSFGSPSFLSSIAQVQLGGHPAEGGRVNGWVGGWVGVREGGRNMLILLQHYTWCLGAYVYQN